MWWWMFTWVRAQDDVWAEACRRAAGPMAGDGAALPGPSGWTVRCAGHSWPVERLPEDDQGRLELLWSLLGNDRALRSEGLSLPPIARPLPAPSPAPRPEAPAARPPSPEGARSELPSPSPALEIPEQAPSPPAAPAPGPEVEALPEEELALLPREPATRALASPLDPPAATLGLSGWAAATPALMARRGFALELRTRRWVWRAGTSRSRADDAGAYISSIDAAWGLALGWRWLRLEGLAGMSWRTARGFAERTSALMPTVAGDLVGTVPLWGRGEVSLLVGGRGEVDLRRTFVLEDDVIELPRGALGATVGLVVALDERGGP